MKESLQPLARATVKQWEKLQQEAQENLREIKAIRREIEQMEKANEQFAQNMNTLLQQAEAEEQHLETVKTEQAKRDQQYFNITKEVEGYVHDTSLLHSNFIELSDKEIRQKYPIKDYLNETEIKEWWINQNNKERENAWRKKSIEEMEIWKESLKSLYLESEREPNKGEDGEPARQPKKRSSTPNAQKRERPE